MYGCRQLVRTLIDHDLIDELRLTVCPFLLVAGDRLFDELADKTLWRFTKVTASGHLFQDSALGFRPCPKYVDKGSFVSTRRGSQVEIDNERHPAMVP